MASKDPKVEAFYKLKDFFYFFTNLKKVKPSVIKEKEEELWNIFYTKLNSIPTNNDSNLQKLKQKELIKNDDYVLLNLISSILFFSDLFYLQTSGELIENKFLNLIKEINSITSEFKDNSDMLFYNLAKITEHVNCVNIRKNMIMYYIVLKIVYINNKKNIFEKDFKKLMIGVYTNLGNCNFLLQRCNILWNVSFVDWWRKFRDTKEYTKKEAEKIESLENYYKNLDKITENISSLLHLYQYNLIDIDDYEANTIEIPEDIIIEARNIELFDSLLKGADALLKGIKNPLDFWYSIYPIKGGKKKQKGGVHPITLVGFYTLLKQLSGGVSFFNTYFGNYASAKAKYNKTKAMLDNIKKKYPASVTPIVKPLGETETEACPVENTPINEITVTDNAKEVLDILIANSCPSNLDALDTEIKTYKETVKNNITNINFLSKINYFLYSSICDLNYIDFNDSNELERIIGNKPKMDEIRGKFNECFNTEKCKADAICSKFFTDLDLDNNKMISLIAKAINKNKKLKKLWNTKTQEFNCPQNVNSEYKLTHQDDTDINNYKLFIVNNILNTYANEIEKTPETDRVDSETVSESAPVSRPQRKPDTRKRASQVRKELNAMTEQQLRDLASSRNITLALTTKSNMIEEIIQDIRKHQGIIDGGGKHLKVTKKRHFYSNKTKIKRRQIKYTSKTKRRKIKYSHKKTKTKNV
jgi:hypothetical protein